VFKSGYHPQTHAVDTNSGPMVVRLDRLRGEVEFFSTAGAFVHLRHEAGETRTAGPIPASGKLLVQSLDEGAWDWHLLLRDHETNSGRIYNLLHGKPQTVERPLQPLPGRLSIVGHDTMEVWDGAKKLGSANEWIRLAAGAYDLHLRRKGFRTQTLRVVIPPNRDISRVAGPFVPEAGSLRVALEAPPAAAEHFARAAKKLSLDGAPLVVKAFPHLEADVGVGQHALRVEVDGFTPVEQPGIEIRDGQTNQVRLALQPLPARPTIVSDPAEADVYRAGGEKLGRAGTELTVPALEILELEVRAPGWQTASVVLPALPPGGAYRHVVKLSRLAGPAAAARDNPWANSLGMKYVPVPGTAVYFCIWETRVQDFEAFVKATGHDAIKGMFSLRKDGWKQRGDTWRSPGFPQGPTHPVVGVSYEDAAAFCVWLTKTERAEGRLPAGWEYRLPTDAEWSAAVGNTTYPWGSAWPPPKNAGNYAGEEAKDKDWPDYFLVIPNWRDPYPRTAPVGSFFANQFGLYDLGGNVWEWCSDWYRKSLNTPEVRKQWPVLDQDQVGTARVLRGASWGYGEAADLASGCRGNDLPENRGVCVGFRVVVAGGVSR
jgi:hypothetical protein